MRVTLPGLHPSQRRVWADERRFHVLACGRRWGKTRLGALRCVTTAMNGGRAWWVAPSYPISAVGWRLIKRLAGQVAGIDKREVDKLIEFPSGGWVQVRSAHEPDSLRGEGLDFLVMDECAFIREAAWAEALRPALSDRRGHAMFISTPAGRNWFWRMWQRGLDELDAEWAAWQFPTSDNPYIAPEEIEAARQMLPERIFAQEYLAEFIDDAGGVFRGVMAAATADHQDRAVDGHRYVFGVDWAKYNDYTVISVVDADERALVALDRFSQIDYTLQMGRLRALYERFQPEQIIAERNSMGEPLVELAQQMGLPIVPFTTTNASKKLVVDDLTLAFERATIRILPDPALIGELQAFESKRLPGGMLRYEAPEGMHDDMVISLALAWHGLGVSGPIAL